MSAISFQSPLAGTSYMITIVPSLLVVPSDKGNANSGNENVTVGNGYCFKSLAGSP